MLLAHLLAIPLFSGAAMPCSQEFRDLAEHSPPWAFAVTHRTEDYFGDEAPWNRDHYERVAAHLVPQGTQVPVFDEFFKRYEHLTGQAVTIRPEQELVDFLKERGIPPSELNHLNGGAQGELFTHPKLGNALIKVTSDAIANAGFFKGFPSACLKLGNGRFTVGIVPIHYRELQAMRESPDFSPAYATVYETQLQNIRRFYRSQASQALHRAYQLMLPGLVAAQAKQAYVDFARVSYIGNGFFVREFYPDGIADSRNSARALLAASGDSMDSVLAALQKTEAHYPVLSEFAGMLIGQVPSFFTSEQAFRASASGRKRLFIIYDLD